MWNDASILADNVGSPQVLKVLSVLNRAITIVVRTDGSGTSQVFTSALDAISPAGFAITPGGLVANSAWSFHDQVTPNGPSQAPYWCGPLTDELQYITVTGCNGGTSSLRTIQFGMIDVNYTPQNVSIDCALSGPLLAAQIVSATSLNIHVAVTNLTVGSGVSTLQIEIGYRGIQQRGKNWYNPVYLSSPAGITVDVKAKQEGGYLNTVTVCTGNPSTLQTMAVWIKAASSVQFSLAWTALSGDSINHFFRSIFFYRYLHDVKSTAKIISYRSNRPFSWPILPHRPTPEHDNPRLRWRRHVG
jgi:hypothetical protein